MNLIHNDYLFVFVILLVIISFLYASVGHGGASGYLALMAFFSVPILIMKPSALLLNLFVSSASFFFYYKANHFKPKLFLPFALPSIPAAFLGGYLSLNGDVYKLILGLVLVFVAFRLLGFFKVKEKETKPIKLPLAIAFGLGIGFLSGILGIGGGVILSPILLLMGWATVKESAAISSLFIFVNSLAGISGFVFRGNSIPVESYYLVPIALFGGLLGAYYGSVRFSNKTLKYVLGSVILLASVKLIFP